MARFADLSHSRGASRPFKQGITPHIDLPGRYSTPIVSISLLSGISFLLRRPLDSKEQHELWVPERSVLVLDGEARWDWEHGIQAGHLISLFLSLFGHIAQQRVCADGTPCLAQARALDVVEDASGDQDRRIFRGTRVSVTFRWMKEGGEVVGGPERMLGGVSR